MKNHLITSLVVGIALSAAAVYFAFHNIPLNDLLHYLGSINYLWTFPAALLALVSFASFGLACLGWLPWKPQC